MNKNLYISILSLNAILLSLVVIFQLQQGQSYVANLYIDKENSKAVTVVDLSIDYDKKNLDLISYSGDGILKTWDKSRFLVMTKFLNLNEPIVRLEFKSKSLFAKRNISILPESQAYGDGVTYKLNYEE